MNNYRAPEFNPQGNLPLAVFLTLCSQPEAPPGVSFDKLWYQEELEAFRSIFSFSGKTEDITFLEVGSGTGRIGYWLARLSEVSNYTGIDIVHEYVDYHMRIDPGRDIRNVSIFELPLDEWFDVVGVPFSLLNMFNYKIQEALIRMILEHHTNVACFDVILADWLPRRPEAPETNARWEKEIVTPEFKEWIYCMPMSEYESLAFSMNVKLHAKDYGKRSPTGKLVKHRMITFYR